LDCNIGGVKGKAELFLFKINDSLCCWHAWNNPKENGANMMKISKLMIAGVKESKEGK